MSTTSAQSDPGASLAGRKILVTGASGFIGTHLCHRLCAAGAKVTAISRAAHESPALQWLRGDVADLAFVRQAFREVAPEVVFHLASHVQGAPHLEQVLPTLRANLLTTVHLLTAAAEHGAGRLVLTGSMTEPDPDQGERFPVAPYAAAKWASSGYARMFHALYGVPIVLARVFMVYGPAQFDRSKLVPYVIQSLLRGESPRLSSGTRLVDWIYVADVVEGLLALAATPGIEGRTLDLGSGRLISIRTIVETLCRLTRLDVEPSFGALAERPMESQRVADVDATFRAVGWRSMVPLDEGLRRTIAWYGEHPDPMA
ncbi:MAG TPA: NAD(P)-dependent oxidoreductase [Vicinamibacterales bacterium]|jgi:nucleoside-diphosphate-sugar epimerase|nr:NAD(P)-dependent oxidoreductase [Vicinamibacterales bacterium]